MGCPRLTVLENGRPARTCSAAWWCCITSTRRGGRAILSSEGRILRQGNLKDEVRIYRYVTEGLFDVYMWQTLETKAGPGDSGLHMPACGPMGPQLLEKVTNPDTGVA